MLTHELIKEFQQAVKEDYGQDINLAEAERMLLDLTGYFDKLSEIHHRDVTEENIKI